MHELVYLPTIVDFGVTTEDILSELDTMKLIYSYKSTLSIYLITFLSINVFYLIYIIQLSHCYNL